MTPAEQVILALRARELTIATAESLTAGMVCAALVDVPGASEVVAGGVVAYRTEQKIAQLGVPAELIRAHGTVHPQVAARMAQGVRDRFGVDLAVSTTGVAGPGESEGHRAGTVVIGLATADGDRVFAHQFAGDRDEVRRQTVAAALSVLVDTLGEDSAT